MIFIRIMVLIGTVLLLLNVPLGMLNAADDKPGYTDTPVIPGQKWKVHDAERPRPKVVAPNAVHLTSRSKDAKVLLETEKDLANWRNGSADAKWKFVDDAMQVSPGTGDIFSRDEFGDMHLHLEFQTPSVVIGVSQGRGNSGVFLMGVYEVQILDSFENPSYADGQCGSIYGQWPPLVNASRPPGDWQSYDIIFYRPRWNSKGLVSPARVTVIHNGIVIQNNREIMGPTRHRTTTSYKNHGGMDFIKGPIKLQDHGNPLRFRNIWVRDLENGNDMGS